MNMSVGGSNNVNDINLENMDIQTALMAVQSQRTNLIDQQLQTQIQQVQSRNNQIANLNNVMTGLNQLSALFASDAKPDNTLDQQSGWKSPFTLEKNTNDAIIAAGLGNMQLTDNPIGGQTNRAEPNHYLQGGVRGDVSKSKIDAAIAQVKGQIDSMGNVQQMDMLRLQSLTNKRGDAYDVMTNFIKKMQDSNSSIIGNMR